MLFNTPTEQTVVSELLFKRISPLSRFGHRTRGRNPGSPGPGRCIITTQQQQLQQQYPRTLEVLQEQNRDAR